MQNAPLVSVIVTCFNSERFIEQAINSILSQSYPNFELIIFDDCSNDSTYEILKNFSTQDKRIKIFRNTSNLGIAKTKNLALQHTNGKYIALMDHDDVSHEDRLKLEVEFLEQNKDYAAIGTQIQVIDENNQIIYTRQYPTTHNNVLDLITVSSPICNPSALIRTEHFKRVGFKYDEMSPGTEDYDLWFRLASKYKLVNLDKTLFSYRLSTNQETSKNSKKLLKQSLAIQRRWIFRSNYFNPKGIIMHLAKYPLLLFPSSFIYNLNLKLTYKKYD